jgi:hypothetical protein
MLKRIVTIAALVAAAALPVAAQASTATVSTGQVQLFLGPGSDNATLSFGDGLALAPAVRHCVRNRCSTTLAITGSSYNCSSSSYSSSIVGAFPDYLFTLRSSVACTFSYTVRFVGTGVLTVNGVGYTIA